MKDVYDGKYLFIEYRALLDIAVLAAFGRSHGLEELPLHISVESILFFQRPFVQYGFYLHPLNPWLKRIDRPMEAAAEAGIRHQWIRKAQ